MKHLFNLALTIFIFASLLFTSTTVTANTDEPIEYTTIDGKDLYQYDVTDTPPGKEIAEEATKRLESRYDLSIDSDDLKVYDLSTKPGERDLLIIPHEIEVVSVKRSWNPDGPVGMSVITATTAK